MRTILLTGRTGFVGGLLAGAFGAGDRVVGVSAARAKVAPTDLCCDLGDAPAVAALSRHVRPDLIVHAAGNKNLAQCAADPALALRANARCVEHLRAAFPATPFVHISSDYVFDGFLGGYDEASATLPDTAYGVSKLMGELAGRLLGRAPFVAVRISALYDAHAAFVTFLARELRAGRPVECFVDAYYSPTYYGDLVRAVRWLAGESAWPKTLHVCGDRVSRCDFARAFARAHGFDPALVRPVTLPAAGRPLFPDLSMSFTLAHRLFGFVPTAHEDALRAMAARGVLYAGNRALPTVQ